MVYPYRCLDCHRSFSIDVPITAAVERRKHVNAGCPHCKSKNVRKLIPKVNIHFKGTGFTKGVR